MSAIDILIRPAEARDARAIAEIYNEAIESTTSTFDTESKTEEDRRRWLADHDDRHPVLVAEREGEVVGWAALTKWSDRPAYDGTVESSFYVAEKHRGAGVGRRLKERLIDEARKAGFHTIIARIAQGNAASRRINESFGFVHVGTLREVGFKFGHWLDVDIMQLMLGDRPPEATRLLVRPECSDDFAEIGAVTQAAFSATAYGHHGEAALIERLRANCSQILSLVAESDGQVVGHALFSPVTIEGCDALAGGMGLGPVSVLPEFQRRGIGSRLIREGLTLLRARNTPYVCVLGDQAFYGRLDFEPADRFGLYSEFGGEDGPFRIAWLVGRPPELGRALLKYRPEFSDLE